MKYEIFEGKDGLWYWRLRARNGRIIADGAQGYRRRRGCLYGISLVKRSGNAPIYELDEDDIAIFKIYKGNDGKWIWKKL